MDRLDNELKRHAPVPTDAAMEWIVRADTAYAARTGRETWPDWALLAPAIASAWPVLRLAWSTFRREIDTAGEDADAVRSVWVGRIFETLGYVVETIPSALGANEFSCHCAVAMNPSDGLGTVKVAVAQVRSQMSTRGTLGRRERDHTESAREWVEALLATDRSFAAGVVTDGQVWRWIFRRAAKSEGNPIPAFELFRVFGLRAGSAYWNFARITHATGSWRAIAEWDALNPDAGSGQGVRWRTGRVGGTGIQLDIDRTEFSTQPASDPLPHRVQLAWDQVCDQALKSIAQESWLPESMFPGDKSTAARSRVIAHPEKLLVLLGFESIDHAPTGNSHVNRSLARYLRHGQLESDPAGDGPGGLDLLIADGVRIVLVKAACRYGRTLVRILDGWNELEFGSGAMLATDGRFVVLRVPVPEFSARAVSLFDLGELVLNSRFDVFRELFRQVGQLRETTLPIQSRTMARGTSVPVPQAHDEWADRETVVITPDPNRVVNALPEEIRDFVRGYQAKSERDRAVLEACLDQLRSIEKSIARTVKSRELQEQRALRQAIQEMLDETLAERGVEKRPAKPARKSGQAARLDEVAEFPVQRPVFAEHARLNASLAVLAGDYAPRSRGTAESGLRRLRTRRMEVPIPDNLLPLPVRSISELWDIPFASLGMLQVALNRDREAAKDLPDGVERNVVPGNFVVVWLGPESENDGLAEWCEKVAMSRMGLRAFPVLGDRWVMLPRSSPRVQELAEILLGQPGPVGLTELKSLIKNGTSVQAINNLLSRMDFVGGGSKESRSRTADRDDMGKPTGTGRGYELRLGPLPRSERQRYLDALQAPSDSAEGVVVPYLKDFHREMIRLGNQDPKPVVVIDGSGANLALARMIAAGQGLRSRASAGWGR